MHFHRTRGDLSCWFGPFETAEELTEAHQQVCALDAWPCSRSRAPSDAVGWDIVLGRHIGSWWAEYEGGTAREDALHMQYLGREGEG